MGVVIAIIVISLVVGIIVYLSHQQAIKPYNYKIVVLGPSGAGKTVYLASMFYRLRIPSDSRRFFLTTTTPQQRGRLLQYLDQIRNIQEDFPPGNEFRDVTEWEFNCQIQTSSESYNLARFTYLDYSGERIKQLRDPQFGTLAQEFQAKLERANIVLGMLDGQQILKVMQTNDEEDHREVEQFFIENIDDILPYLLPCKRPVHFIITKWDLLEKKGYKLEDIISRLEERHPPLKDFVEYQIGRNNLLRFIPVSSVGMSFAELQADGSMKKISGGRFNPYLVEMPLACVLYDNLLYEIEQPAFNKQKWIDIASSPNPLQTLSTALVKSLFAATKLTISGPFSLSIDYFFDGFIRLIGKDGDDETRQPRNGVTKGEVTKEAIDDFGLLMRSFERKFPASNLRKFRAGRRL